MTKHLPSKFNKDTSSPKKCVGECYLPDLANCLIGIGQARRNSRVKDQFKRSEHIWMTKAGRVALNKCDYSPNAIRASVQRSLDSLNTTYLDCLYLHNFEFVTEVLTKYIESIKSKYGTLPDVVQHYAHFTIHYTKQPYRQLAKF